MRYSIRVSPNVVLIVDSLAAFVIAYIILMIFAGLPTFYMEMVIGQYASLTPHLLYSRMSPIFTG
jgi:SNF family Na+-dependent transporter